MEKNLSKHCSTCGELKPLDEFPPRKISVDGHRGVCRDCDREGRKGRYQKNILWEREKKKIYMQDPKNQAKRLIWNRKVKAQQRAEGRCQRCGNETETFGNTYCESCCRKKNTRNRERLIERGCCIRCGSNLSLSEDITLYLTCVNCRDKTFAIPWL
jgi:hypothetical protein